MQEYEIAVLKLLKKQNSMSYEELEKRLGMGKGPTTSALGSLEKNGAVALVRLSVPKITREGESYLAEFPEERIVKDVSKSGSRKALKEISNQIGLGKAIDNRWVEKDGIYAKLTKLGADIAAGKSGYKIREILNQISEKGILEKDFIEKNSNEIRNLVKRNLLDLTGEERITRVEITEKGKRFEIAEPRDEITALTRGMIVNRGWTGRKFRSYDVNADVDEVQPARFHPMHEFIDTIRDIWLRMGFVEVSGPIIESAFWVFDALFSPQDHPTRDMQDTFFLSNPKELDIEDLELLNRVRKMHEKGWKEAWREEVAKQAVLRTHTTSVSARYIKKYSNALESNFPMKLFSIGKVFRNESLDYKHLAELHMTDGIVIGNGLTLANLIDVLKRFYTHLGFEDVKFMPSYFPFVEPGVQVYYYNEKLQANIELNGAGVMRKEITKAMGTNKTVLAWGIGIERLTMHFMNVDYLPDLYKNDLGWLRKRPELSI